jgi:hypothetical protein
MRTTNFLNNMSRLTTESQDERLRRQACESANRKLKVVCALLAVALVWTSWQMVKETLKGI